MSRVVLLQTKNFFRVSSPVSLVTLRPTTIATTLTKVPKKSLVTGRVFQSSNMAVRYAKDQATGFENRISKIAIIGGGGQVGKHLLKALVDKSNFEITAIQRPDSKSSLPSGVAVKKADYSGDDDSQLVEALRGQQALIVTMSVMAPRDTIPKISRAAAKAGVLYVMPNWIGHDDANDELCQDSFLTPSRDAIKAEFANFENTAYVLLVCNFWYEFSLAGGPDRYGFDFKNRSFIWFDEGDVKFNSTTWPQCGRALANLFSLPILPEDANDSAPTVSQFANKAIHVASFLVDQKRMFESVKRVTGTTDADWTISRESSKQRYEEGKAEVLKGNFGAFTKALYSRMFFPTEDGNLEAKYGLDNKLLGLPEEDFDEWTKTAVGMGERGEVATSH